MAAITPSSSNDKSSSTSTPATSVSPPDANPRLPLPLLPQAHLTFNLFADSFTPKWLQDINSVRPVQVLYSPTPPYTNFEDYARTFLPDPLFRTAPSTQFLASIQSPRYALDAPILGPQIPLPSLTMRNYAVHFRNGLLVERTALAEEFKQYNLYDVQLEGVPSPPQGIYKLHVPGLREYIPAVYVGDAIVLRSIRVFPVRGPQAEGWFDGREHIVYIWYIDRLKEVLQVCLPDLEHFNYFMGNRPRGFNIQFHPRSTVETYQMMAADVFAQRMPRDGWMKGILFPEQRHAIWLPERELGRVRFDANWVDKELNYEQQKAIDAIISNSYGDLPFLIYGPPGTGKTKTVIEAILQLIPQKHVHILAVAPSASAADTIALRLAPHLRPGEMYRINDIARTFAEVPDRLLMYCHTAQSHFSFPAWEKLMAARVVVTDCMSAFELIKARCTNQDFKLVREMYGTAFGVEMAHWHWTHLFMDEAAQAREPEALIPLMIVAPEPNSTLPPPKFVMAGDSNQLGPVISSPEARDAGIDISLFDRLLRRPVYAHHPLARRNVYKPLPNKGEGWIRPAFVNLVRNYRSHDGILMMPSAMFYNSTLIAEAAPRTTSLTKWTMLANPRIPVLFVPSSGDDSWIPDTAGWFNTSEIRATKALITHLLERKNTPGTRVLQKDIAVIAPFREHVVRTRTALRNEGLLEVRVGTVENYQGGEMRVIVLNCVRSKTQALEWDRMKGRGVVGERRRFNVAITRAKELLIIVGNPHILQMDPYWRGYLSFIKRNNLSSEPFEFEDEQSDRWMSSLERGMRIREEVMTSTSLDLGGGRGLEDSYTDEEMWKVGAVLEQLVLEDEWDYHSEDHELKGLS